MLLALAATQQTNRAMPYWSSWREARWLSRTDLLNQPASQVGLLVGAVQVLCCHRSTVTDDTEWTTHWCSENACCVYFD